MTRDIDVLIREHLYRRHALPIHCARCCLIFKSEAELREHYRSLNTCDTRDDEPPEGFDNEQEKKLRCRKRSTHTQTEEEKWKEMYRTLFPNDDEATFPSPCKRSCSYQKVLQSTNSVIDYRTGSGQ